MRWGDMINWTLSAVKRCNFKIVRFKDCPSTSNLRAASYRSYDVLWYTGSENECVGYLVFKKLLSGSCDIKYVIQRIRTADETRTYGSHTHRHEKLKKTNTMTFPLRVPLNGKITNVEALACAYHFLPFLFSYRHEGMHEFIFFVFEAGKMTSASCNIDWPSLLLLPTAVNDAIKCLPQDLKMDLSGSIHLSSTTSIGGGLHAV